MVQRSALSPERNSFAVDSRGDNDTLDSCYTQDFSYDCYAKHTIKLLKRLSVFYSANYKVIIGLNLIEICSSCRGNCNNNRN